MAALGVLLIGVGAYLCYDAVKSSAPAPVVNAKAALTRVSGSSTTAAPTTPNTVFGAPPGLPSSF
jgi:hypothetical protein